ncbi:MAG: Aldehyde reductase [Haloplasmataceae bacterium]|jgi:diketogulonate reductase-like aldo/keto reductase|nr:Aldehyde reductase [Haloplasmataceae bacterium]
MYIALNNGVKIPMVGIGTFKSKAGNETYNAVLSALKAGYRHIDTAAIYGNEESVGKAIRDSGIPREDLFLTTKLWKSVKDYDSTKKAFQDSLNKLGVEYLDLYLIHWPTTYEIVRETYRAMEDLFYENKIRALGVSNFLIHHMDDLLKNCRVIPTINQIELHPRLQQYRLQQHCEESGIFLTSYSPLIRGEAFEIEELQLLAKKYNKSIVNIIVRWGIQRNIIMIPKSVTPERIIDNFNVFDFELSDDDMQIIRKLNTAKRYFSDPDNIEV